MFCEAFFCCYTHKYDEIRSSKVPETKAGFVMKGGERRICFACE
jgi:hypothetical protein